MHLTEQQYNNGRYINGNIFDLFNGSNALDAITPTFFSPFGMGVLDFNVTKYVYDFIRRDQFGLRFWCY